MIQDQPQFFAECDNPDNKLAIPEHFRTAGRKGIALCRQVLNQPRRTQVPRTKLVTLSDGRRFEITSREVFA